ncbi:hypothetical protein O6H91_07G071300 [Diphasiastrum complanatum]|uniref:Uncharacterized protein n=1 Tax=Diphasiastrum complanatum TaxID=34168 RepID=A0ACC2D6P0_DIPCM|nr:hypothetical protein O6H91_07G071300 [Diphasiastrum complanatum]
MEDINEDEMLRFLMDEGTPVHYPLRPPLQMSSAPACRLEHVSSPVTPQASEPKIQTKNNIHYRSLSTSLCRKIQSKTACHKNSDDDYRLEVDSGGGTIRKLNLGELMPSVTNNPEEIQDLNSHRSYDDNLFNKSNKVSNDLKIGNAKRPSDYGLIGDFELQKQASSGLLPTESPNRQSQRSFSWSNLSPHLKALGQMSFRKAFMILANFPCGEWKKALQVNDLGILNALKLENLEVELQRRAAEHYKEDIPHRIKTNWEKMDEEHHLAYKATINRKGECIFQGPCVERGRTPLQRAFGNESILQVHFEDVNNDFNAEGFFKKFGREGIVVGLRQYEFFTYKDPKAKKKQGLTKDNPSSSVKCFFVCTKSDAEADNYDPNFREFENIEEARHVLMHISTEAKLPKYIARLQLALSQTIRLDLDFSNVVVDEIKDVVCMDEDGNTVYDENSKPLIHTDGTGFISADLARLCPCNIFKGGKQNQIDEQQEYPLLMQIRLFHKGNVYKGTLLVNNKLKENTILYRPSMRKVEADEKRLSPSFNSLEICNTSRKPVDARLFQHLVLLLHLGGVPESVILQFLEESLQEIMTCFRDRSAAHKVISRSGDFAETCEIALRMVFSVSMKDAYLQKLLWDLSKSRLQELKKARIPVRDTFNLMGCADPTGMLKRNQVAIILGDGPIYASKVLVYKPPGLHPGDIHVFEATWCQELEEIVGSGKYGIFFSVKGSRAVVDEMANSDLDGDLYWVCRNPEKTPTDLKDLQDKHFQSFYKSRFYPSAMMGQAANNWLAHMDRFMSNDIEPVERAYHWETAIKLVDIYYDAVDADKSGERVTLRNDQKTKHWPHYMEKEEGKYFQEYTVYRSSSILGKIYDKVKKILPEDDICLLSPNGTIELDPAFEYPGYKHYLTSWGDHYRQYRVQVQNIMKKFSDEDSRSAAIDKLLQNYRQILYRATSMKDSPRAKDELYQEASAIYTVVYAEAQHKVVTHQDKKKLSHGPRARQGFLNESSSKPGLQFAWKVAGVALCRLYAEREAEEPIVLAKRAWQEINSKRQKLKHENP